MSDQSNVTAHHEAAHVVVLYRSAGYAGGPVTIVPNPQTGTLGSAINAIADSGSEDDVEAEIVSCYAGGLADTKLGVPSASQCAQDEDNAADLMRAWGWEARESEFRSRAQALVDQHWNEIVAVAEELLRVQTLDDTEIETIADIAAGVPDVSIADLQRYRLLKGDR